MNDLVEAPLHLHPTINVRALLDHSARVTKVRARAPLRLGFAGGGTDVSPYCDTFGGCVLNATIAMFAHCSIEVRSDQKVKFVALDWSRNSRRTPMRKSHHRECSRCTRRSIGGSCGSSLAAPACR